MKVSEITTKYVTPNTTGYTACTGLGLTMLSGISKNSNFRKIHKPLSIFTIIASAMHIGLIEYYKHRYKMNKNNDKV